SAVYMEPMRIQSLRHNTSCAWKCYRSKRTSLPSSPPVQASHPPGWWLPRWTVTPQLQSLFHTSGCWTSILKPLSATNWQHTGGLQKLVQTYLHPPTCSSWPVRAPDLQPSLSKLPASMRHLKPAHSTPQFQVLAIPERQQGSQNLL